jgi:aspartyl-tRNA(Asn)/glutamyl-tRNA(Gln) amidotransferase subunit B
LPDAKRKRYEGLGITPYNASVLTADVEIARWFDSLLDSGAEPKAAANWTVSEYFGALNRLDLTVGESPVSPPRPASF